MEQFTKIKVRNFTNSIGNQIANQFIINRTDDRGNDEEIFQSYDSIIAIKLINNLLVDKLNMCGVILDENYWDYSRTTGKYRNQFLGETKKETERKIKTGEYLLVDLN